MEQKSSVPSRAWRDTKTWLLSSFVAWLLVFVGTVGAGVLAALLIPTDASSFTQALYGAIGAASALSAILIGTYLVHLIITPYRQRNELSIAYAKMNQSLERRGQDEYLVGNFSKLNDKGIERTIREWLDKPAFTIKRRDVPDTYFQFDVDDQYARGLSVRREKGDPSLILLLTNLLFDPDTVARMRPRQTQIAARLTLEMSRLGINYHLDQQLKKLDVYDALPLDDSLTEVLFIERMGLLIRALIIAKSSVLDILPELGQTNRTNP